VDASVPPSIPSITIKQLPDFDIVIPLTSELMERYVKSCGALPDILTFTVMCDGKKTELILGYTDINTTRIALSVDAEEPSKIAPISFHARYLKDIILVNKEATAGTLSIAPGGLAKIVFTLPDFDVTYYLPEIKVED
jgi:hypothetical protein